MFFLKINNNYIILEKAKNLTKLIKKVIINKKGQQQTVYIKPDADVFKMKEDQINKFIESIRNEKIEHGLTVNNKGEVLVYKMGKANQVRYTKQELRKINGAKLSIHNHPEGGAFSDSDIVFLCKNNIKQIKVSNLEFNRKIDYSLILLKKVGDEEIINIVKEYFKSYNDVFNKFNDEIKTGKKTAQEAREKFSHDFMINFTNKFKDIFNYERQKK